jgi:hypothetical protein
LSKGSAVPKTTGRPPKYPFATVKVNGTFILPSESFTKVSAQSYVYQRSKQLRKKFKLTEQGNGDFQVRRTN